MKSQNKMATNNRKGTYRGKMEIIGGNENDAADREQWKTAVNALCAARHEEGR